MLEKVTWLLVVAGLVSFVVFLIKKSKGECEYCGSKNIKKTFVRADYDSAICCDVAEYSVTCTDCRRTQPMFTRTVV